MGVPRFVAGAAITEPYDPNLNQFAFGSRFLGKFHREYILIQFNNGAGDDAAVAGRFLAGFDSAGSYGAYEGTADLNDGDVLISLPWGQMQSAPSDGQGVWCQYSGQNRLACLTDTNVGQGDNVCLDSTLVGGIKPVAGSLTVVGIARAVDAAAVLAAGSLYLKIPL